MNKAGLHWRDRHYATHLDTVLASAVEMNNRQRLQRILPRHQPDTQSNPLSDINQKLKESIPMPSSVERRTLIALSPFMSTSPVSPSGFSPRTQPSSITSPQSSFSASPSSSSTDVTHCSLCPALFTGSLRDRSSNLRRHVRTTRNHGNMVGHMCTVPGCNVVISRSDNLGKHLRTVHEGNQSTTLRRQGARKRRRDRDSPE